MSSPPPFRHVEHVGSLLRPPALRAAVQAFRRGELSAAGLRAAEDAAVRGAIAMQERVGLEVLTDGEFRRPSYWAHWVSRLDGLGIDEAVFRFHDDKGNENAFTAPSVEGRIRRPQPLSGDEYAFASDVTDRVVKITMPSPSTFLFWRGESTLPEAIYPTSEEFFADLCEVFRAEIQGLAEQGCRYVQLDEVPLIMLADPAVRDVVRRRGEEPDEVVQAFIDALNGAVAERPPGITVAMHMCRGNYKGRWLADAGYDAVAEKIFNEVEVDHFLLEYDSARAGGFEPLRLVPPHKRVVLGLVSSKTADMEQPGELRRRIEQATEHIDLDRLGVSPQCGFASTAGGNPLTEDAQEAKLALLVEVASELWPNGE